MNVVSISSIFLLFAIFVYSCSSEQVPENTEAHLFDETEQPELAALSQFTGTWITPDTYRGLEDARIRLSLNEAEFRVSGPLQYVRVDPSLQPVSDSGRLFVSATLSGSSAARTLNAEIRNERGDVLGEARLALREGRLHVQLINPVPDVAAIFVLEPEN
ncbi:MAG: hypothetical protein LAT75_10920 [Candidatus Cyclonatronum sp.]|uniref:hypothetical protein n=1 Tax=Cyclonatronum sp. TaxID=3024185 RepID=UPI0025BAC758|nr:hypothetical protein [Cyclonatronum sp.]MCH8487366.1 hypothetical protein [Cyclonatronum sp.]